MLAIVAIVATVLALHPIFPASVNSKKILVVKEIILINLDMSHSSYLESLFSLQGQVAVLTGGTRGIGQSLALALARAGADIVLIQRDQSNQTTAMKIRDVGRKVWIATCDLSSKEQVGSVVKRITLPESDGGLGLNIDILVNCGGIQRRHPAHLFPDNDWEEVLQVNLNTVWTLCRDVGHHILERRESAGDPSAAPRGKIINIASLLSFQGGFTVPAYAAAKHGVLGITKAFSNEWSSKGINVNCIAPGYIDTDMNTALIANPTRARQILERIPAGRWGNPGDFEGAIVFLASRASDYVCGETVVVDGGWMGR